MVYGIVWSPEALSTYLEAIEYLEKVWTEKEVMDFIERVNDKVATFAYSAQIREARKEKKYTSCCNTQKDNISLPSPASKKRNRIGYFLE